MWSVFAIMSEFKSSALIHFSEVAGKQWSIAFDKLPFFPIVLKKKLMSYFFQQKIKRTSYP